MPLSKKIAIGAACLMIVGVAGFRVSGGPARGCRLRLGNARAACYQRFFTSRLVSNGVAGAVAILDTLSQHDRDVSRRAHEYAHGIGIEAYMRYPDIVSTFTACGDRAASGCRHGFIQGYFEARQQVTTPEIEAFCRPFKEPSATRWILFQCVHGMGHGLAMFYDHNLPQALAMCDQLGDAWDRESCYGGAFMESDMNAIAPHHPASELAAHSHHGHGAFTAIDPADPLYPCSKMEDRHLRACFEIQTAVILYLNHGDIGAAARTCDRAVVPMRDDCYRSLGRDITSYSLRDPEESARLCGLGSAEYQPACYVGVAKALVDWTASTGNAFTFCGIVAARSAAGLTACYGAVGEQIAALYGARQAREQECARVGLAPAVDACRKGAQL
ncbi:MAG TPA: hypothetical protein VN513_04015 [Gemmatimonadales bacterium]|nr:hypothetical protein [Gemmatimonadales bacterium]